jgi:tetratricopeptide (TPR) repeat protein
MTEALITDLSKIGALKVIARSSVMRYKEIEKLPGEIAQELNVEALIQGSVVREADQVRITAQLIDAATGQNLWADRYERNLTSILALQGEVAQAIARQIQVTLTPGEEALLTRAQQVNPEAHEAYLKGMSHWNTWTPASLETALRYFELALEKDPDYALAYMGVSWVWAVRRQLGFVPFNEATPKVNAALSRALELDDTLAEAHFLLATIKAWVDWDWGGADPGFRRALELNPNYAMGRAYYASYLGLMRRLDEALAQIELALELDPFNPVFHSFYGQVLQRAGRYDDALELAQRWRRMEPNNPGAVELMELASYKKGQYEEAFEFGKAQAAMQDGPELEQAMAQGYEEAGYLGGYSRAAEALAALSRAGQVSPHSVALYYILAGQEQEALDWLERGIEERNPNICYVLSSAFSRTLRDEPRFQDLLRRINFPEDVIARILNEER